MRTYPDLPYPARRCLVAVTAAVTAAIIIVIVVVVVVAEKEVIAGGVGKFVAGNGVSHRRVGVAGPGQEAAAGGAGGPGGGDGEAGEAVDVAHDGALALPVGGVVLDDAEGVDPQVAQADGAADGDGVAEGLGEAGQGYAGEVGVEGGRGGADDGLRVGSPAVAQRGVGGDVAVGDEEADVLRGRGGRGVAGRARDA